MKRTLQTVLFALIAMMTPIGAWAQETTTEAKWGASADALTSSGTLADAITAAREAGSTVRYIQLQGDVDCSMGNLLVIESGVFTLDLNGHTLSSSVYYCIEVRNSDTHITLIGEAEGSKVVCTAENYAAVSSIEGGSLTIRGGSYESNIYAVHAYDPASITILGGTFTSSNDHVFNTGGNLTIQGGTFTAANDVTTILYHGGTTDLSAYADITGISVTNQGGSFIPGAEAETILLPSGYCFYYKGAAVTKLSNYSDYTIGVEPDTKYTVTFAAGGGEGTMEDAITYDGSYTLPECTFTAPEGKIFKAWQVGESEYQPGEAITLTANTTVTALWRDYVAQIVIKMQDSYDDGWNGNCIAVKKNGEEIGTITITSESGNSNTVRYDYDKSAVYTFYWQYGGEGSCPYECSFEILVENEVIFTAAASDCESYADGQLLHTIEAVVETLTLADGQLTEYSNAATLSTVGTLTYTRTLPNLAWNALYVPFEIPMSTLADSYDVAYINDVHSYDNNEDGEIDDLKMEVIKITAGTLNANHPYLIRAKSEAAKAMSLVLTDATLLGSVENKVTCSSVYMQFAVTGTYKQLTADDLADESGNTSLVITTDGSWQQLAEDGTLSPFRLYLTMTALDGSPVKVAPEAARSMRIVTRGETTSIDNGQLTIDNSQIIYDLQGRRVAQPTKGIYIVNGKKVIIK